AIDLTIVGSDPDVGQTLALTVTGVSVSAQFVDHGGGSGTFHWQTVAGNQGSYPLTFQVSDGTATGQKPVTLLVDKLETPPVLDGPIADHTIAVGNLLTINLSATDADGDTLQFSMSPAVHAGASLTDNGNGTAQFKFTPTAADYG